MLLSELMCKRRETIIVLAVIVKIMRITMGTTKTITTMFLVTNTVTGINSNTHINNNDDDDGVGEQIIQFKIKIAQVHKDSDQYRGVT